MSARNFRKMLVLVVALVCMSAGLARADKLQLQEKLSKDVRIQLNDVTIAEVLEKIGQKAGVKFVLSDEAAWKLPQGEATRLSVALDGPLAESMAEMLNAFFMRYAVGDEEITIYPRPELEHILGRPTPKQLELLKTIYARPIGVYFVDQEQRTINEALGQHVLISPIHMHAQLNDFLRQLVGKDPIYQPRDRRRRQQAKMPRGPELNGPEPTEFRLPTPVTLVQLLSQVSFEGEEPRNTRWYISGMDFPGQVPEIQIVEFRVFAGLKLDQRIDISYKNESVDKILRDLASLAGVGLIVGEESYLNEYKLSVDMENITVAQAVRSIADMIGAACDVGYRGIEVEGPGKPEDRDKEAKKSKSGDKARSEGYIGKISIPMDGGKYFIEFMLRENDLTEELKKLREEKMKEILGEKAVEQKTEKKSD